MKIIVLNWIDACASSEWEDIDQAKELHPHAIQSVGHLLYEDEEKITLAMSWDTEREAVSECLSVPKKWISEKKEIEF